MYIHWTRDRKQPLNNKIEKIIRERIISGKYPPGTYLPSETKLAAELNVSRPTLRDALSTLVARGMINRRPGRGTFIRRIPYISYPLDRDVDIQELISENCYRPSFTQEYCGLEAAGPVMAETLQIPTEAQVLVSHKVFTADDVPMIFCVNTLAVNLFKPGLAEQVLSTPEILEPFFEFLKREIGIRIEYSIASVSSVNASECRFHSPLPLSDKTPVLEINQVVYTTEGRPVCHICEYHPGNKMRVELTRLLHKQ